MIFRWPDGPMARWPDGQSWQIYRIGNRSDKAKGCRVEQGGDAEGERGLAHLHGNGLGNFAEYRLSGDLVMKAVATALRGISQAMAVLGPGVCKGS